MIITYGAALASFCPLINKSPPVQRVNVTDLNSTGSHLCSTSKVSFGFAHKENAGEHEY